MEREIVIILKEEIDFLQECIARTSSGGWSSHNVSLMQERIRLLYEKLGPDAVKK